MRPLSFIPGPAKIRPEVYRDIETAVSEGILELSHRSQAFTSIADQSLANLRSYLSIPAGYTVLYSESATFAWHSMIANAVATTSAHIVTGAFSKRAAVAALSLGKTTHEYTIHPQNDTPVLPDTIQPDAELVTICYSESSNGSAWTASELATLRTQLPDALIGVDVTSCAGAVELDLSLGDIWYFSVQKAFGLPAGLGVLILSKRALDRARILTERGQNLAGMWSWHELVENYQHGRGLTPYTPNMLGIYLMAQQTDRLLSEGGLSVVAATTEQKAARLYDYFSQHTDLTPYIPNRIYRSPTVITLTGTTDAIVQAHATANEHNAVLGQGYAELKNTTLRIANFPAITNEDIDHLCSWL